MDDFCKFRIIHNFEYPAFREDLVKHVCGWFTNGLAHIVTTYITNLTTLQGCQDDLLTILLNEIGQVVKTVGLCQFNGAKVKDDASYHYLKETRSSLATLFLGIIHIAPEIAKNPSQARTKEYLNSQNSYRQSLLRGFQMEL